MPILRALVSLLAAAKRDDSSLVDAPLNADTQTTPAAWGTFSTNVIWQPSGGDPSAVYPRHIELADGHLLATSMVAGFEPAIFRVFESADGGATWAWVSNVTDQVNGWGLDAQPAFAELQQPLGAFDTGTIFVAGNSWATDDDNGTETTGTKIDLYASTDRARSWEFVSHIANGTQPSTADGAHPVWEPFLMIHNGLLVCYYSDSRDDAHSQKLAHQLSADGVRWEPPVDDVAYGNYSARPGMTTVTHIPPLDQWILTYEYPHSPTASDAAAYPVYYRLAANPLAFASAEGRPLVARDGTTPSSSPYVAWSPVGGDNGTIFVSDADHQQVFVNRQGGDVGAWDAIDVPQPAAYSRSLHVFREFPDHLAIFGGGTYDGDETAVPLSLSVVSIEKALENVSSA